MSGQLKIIYDDAADIVRVNRTGLLQSEQIKSTPVSMLSSLLKSPI